MELEGLFDLFYLNDRNRKIAKQVLLKSPQISYGQYTFFLNFNLILFLIMPIAVNAVSFSTFFYFKY